MVVWVIMLQQKNKFEALDPQSFKNVFHLPHLFTTGYMLLYTLYLAYPVTVEGYVLSTVILFYDFCNTSMALQVLMH